MAVIRHRGFVVWDGARLPRGVDGITLWRVVLVRRGCTDPASYLMRHEGVHVRQWKRLGVVRFTARYLSSYLLWRVRGKSHYAAYLRIPMEVEADWVARRMMLSATDQTRPEVSDRTLR